MKKLFACDLDGTLLNSKHLTDDYINEGIQKVLDSKYSITIATGRSKHQVDIIGFPKGMYTVCANGALVYDKEGNILFKKIVQKDILQLLLEQFSYLPIEYTSPTYAYCTTSKEVYTQNIPVNEEFGGTMDDFIKNIQFDTPIKELLDKDICKVNLSIQKGVDQKFLDFINEHTDKLINAATNDEIIELTDPSVNKGEGIHFLAQYLGIEDDQVNVYGDAGNDIEMLKRFKYSYVPCSGLEQAKQLAYQVIGHNKDYAVINHILDQIS